MLRAFGHDGGDGGGEIGFAELEKRGFDHGKSAGARQIGGHLPDGLVGGFDARTVRKEDDGSRHFV